MSWFSTIFCKLDGGHYWEILDNMGAKHCLNCHKLVGVEYDDFEA